MSTVNSIPTDQAEQGLPENANTSISAVQEILSMLLKKWWLFLIVGILAGIAGIWYASTQKPSYKSRLSFALDNGGGEGGLSSALNLASQFGIGVGDSKDIFEGDNILEIMKSRRMVERVLLTVDTFAKQPYTLIEFYLYGAGSANSKLAVVHYPVTQERSKFSYTQDSILNAVYMEFVSDNIIAQRPDRKLSIYEVSVSTESEQLTKVFTDRLVAETNHFYTELSSKKARQTLDVLEERVAAMKGGLNASISTRAATQDANLNPAFSASQIPILKEQVNMQVYSGAYAEMFKNLEMARFQYLKQIPLMQIIDDADYPMKKVKMGKLVTGIKMAILAGLLTVLILWLVSLFKKKK